MTLRRFLPLALVAGLVALPLRAQAPTFLGAVTPSDLVGGMTLRGLVDPASGSTALHLALLGDLGSTGLRDAYGATFGGGSYSVAFRMQYTVATGRFSVFVSGIAGAARTADAGAVASTASAASATFGGATWAGTEFVVDGLASGFNLLRLQNPSTALVLRSLVATSNGTTTTLVGAGTTLSSAQAAQYVGLTSAYDFSVTGRYDLTGAACSGSSCRLDLGLATSASMGPTVVAEPATLSLLGAGLVVLGVGARRRRQPA
jgi:hypothetical protein